MIPPRPASSEPSPLAAGLLALVLMLQFAAASWLWPLMETSGLVHAASYRAAWLSSGFRGLPIEELVTALDRRLPAGTPVRLGPALQANGQWAQRVKEGIYPRRVQADAAVTLDLGKGDLAIVQSPHGPLTLGGRLPPAPQSPPPPWKLDLGLSFWRVLVHLVAAWGWGAAVVLLLGRLRARGPLPLAVGAAVCGPVFYGLGATLATLVQRPLPFGALTAIGVTLALAALALEGRQVVLARDWRDRLRWVRQPETWLLGAFVALLLWHMAIWPVVGWDGRSIWIYRAKQIAFNGFLTVADAVNMENFFSHMEYPLLYPTWLAHFATGAPFRERELAVGAVLLHLCLTVALGWLARRRLGRWVGAAFVGAVWVVTAGSVERGYADGLLTELLLMMMFALDDAALEPFAWLAGLGAALTKQEGLVFAVLLGGLFLLLHPRFRARRLWPRFAPVLVVLPAAVPALWARLIHIHDQYAGAKVPLRWAVAVDRLVIIWNGVFSIARESPPIALVPALIGGYLALELAGRRSWAARLMAATAAGEVLFSVSVMMMTPYDLAGQVSTAMERLLLHALFALLAAIMVALVEPRAAAQASAPTPAAPPP